MQLLSDRYQSIVARPYTVEVMLRVNGHKYGADALVSVTTDCGVFKDECPAVGNAVSGCITAEMLTPEDPIPMTSKMELFCRAVSRQDGAKSEWIPKGVFWLDTRKQELTDSGLHPTILLSGYDALLKAEVEYTPTGQWPKTDKEVLDDICTRLGIHCDEQLGHHYSVPYPADYTCRELLGFIAAAYGGNWIIDEHGDLVLLRLNRSTERFPLDAQRVTAGGSLTPITQVTVHKMDGTTYTAGSAGRTLNVDCPWATQSMANSILSQVEGYRYYPFTAESSILPPSVQLGDDCGLGPIFSIQAEYQDGIIADISAPPEEEIAHNYPSPAGSRGGGGAGGRALAAARKLEELSDSFGVELDNVRSALDVYVKETEDLQEASAALTTRVSGAETALEMNTQSIEDLQEANTMLDARVDGAEASISLNAKNIDGVGKSVATIQADVVELKGRVNLTDTAYVTEGHGLGVKGSIVGNGNLLVSGYIGTTANGPIMLAGKNFIPTEITSTSGTVLVLGTA